ncbi:polysaccharide deacetylase family protein [Roseomonas sp. SSH11]|uniref:Chitooligosaccharide deacetylase n=1 Tax=Pararoseomonas baculiformis TaxID=2820812 RepID=A0ABS4AJI3_9PROT|nr:polysaccharide deacetylase family protein [Pararoseomonas baculiformis]MBP0447193.1 polysaccharide deacetylase family protein [Pararoseomonas baculiformis]
MAGPVVTLSFDNGPEPEVTPGVLDTLRRRGLRATFFVIGRKLAEHRKLAERAHAEGHWIGNHTWTHERPLGEMPDEAATAEAEIGRTQALIGNLSHPDRLFRPVGGGGTLGPHLLSGAALDHLTQGGFTCVLWNAVPGDFRDAENWPERALAMCRGPDPVALVLHDLPNGAMRQLDRFLGRLEDAGARFAQDFPPSCIPLHRGEAIGPIARYTTRHTGAAA